MIGAPLRKRWALPAMTMPRLWALAALSAIFAASALGAIAIGDFWWHLRLGEIIVSRHEIPARDTFSFLAAGQPYLYQQWLGEVYFYLLYRVGDIALVSFANSVAITATGAIIMLSAREISGKLTLSAGCAAIFLLVGLNNRDVRPQVLGFLFFALCYWLLLRYRLRRSAALWLIPVIAAVWANVHGSVILGFGLCLIVLVAEAAKAALGLWPQSTLPRRQLVGLGLATAAIPVAVLANPAGAGIFAYVLTIERSPVIRQFVPEWFAPSLRSPEDLPFFIVLLCCVAVFLLSHKALDLADAALFVVFSALALHAVRNSIWFAIIAAPLAAGQIAAVAADWRARWYASRRRPLPPPPGAPVVTPSEAIANGLFALLFVALAALTLPWLKPALPLPPKYLGTVDPDTPKAAVEYVAAHYPEARFFHPLTYGSYMIWASPDGPPVLIDGRIELYPPSLASDYIAISNADDWEARLTTYGVDHLLLAKQPYKGFQLELLSAVERSPGWHRVYEDKQAAVYVKR